MADLARAIALVKDGAQTILQLADLTAVRARRRARCTLDRKDPGLLTEETRGRLQRLREQLAGTGDWTVAGARRRDPRISPSREGVGIGKFGPALRGVLSGGAPAPDLASHPGSAGQRRELSAGSTMRFRSRSKRYKPRARRLRRAAPSLRASRSAEGSPMENKVQPGGSATLTFGDKTIDLPILKGSVGPGRGRHPQALRRDRRLHLRPRLHLHGLLRKPDHLHRRRQGHPALPRLSDRPAGRELQLPRGLLPAAERRAAERRGAAPSSSTRSRTTPWCTTSSTASSRASAATLSRWRSWCGAVGRAVGLLSRQHQHPRSEAAGDLRAPH